MPLLERQQVGKREMLADYIARVDAKAKPLLAMIPKGKDVTNMLVEWQMDDFEDALDLAVEDGKDAETFDNASPNRFRAQTYAMKVRATAMVSDLAENVSDVAGVTGGNEQAESIMKKLEALGRAMEGVMCGDTEHQAGGAGIPYKGRGLGVWIAPRASQTLLPVAAQYITPTNQLDNTAMASFNENLVNNVLESSFQQTGKVQNFDLLTGTGLRRQFSAMTRTQVGPAGAVAGGSTGVAAGTNTWSTIRMYQTTLNRAIDNVIDNFNGDFGHVNIHPTLFNGHPNFGGSAAAQPRRGYLLLMNLLELNYKRKPRVKPLEDRGGGPRFLIDAIFSWKVKNPLGLGKFYATT